MKTSRIRSLLIDALKNGPLNATQASELAKVHFSVAQRYLKTLVDTEQAGTCTQISRVRGKREVTAYFLLTEEAPVVITKRFERDPMTAALFGPAQQERKQ